MLFKLLDLNWLYWVDQLLLENFVLLLLQIEFLCHLLLGASGSSRRHVRWRNMSSLLVILLFEFSTFLKVEFCFMFLLAVLSLLLRMHTFWADWWHRIVVCLRHSRLIVHVPTLRSFLLLLTVELKNFFETLLHLIQIFAVLPSNIFMVCKYTSHNLSILFPNDPL